MLLTAVHCPEKPILLPLDNIALFLMPVVAALGAYLFPIHIGAVNLYLFRLLVIIFAGLILVMRPKFKINLLLQFYLLLMTTWLVWGAASGYWTPDIISGFKDFIALCLGLIASLIIILYVNNRAKVKYLRLGWVFAYLFTGMVALWEITTGNHLTSSFTESGPDYYLRKLFVSSTFGNPNNYAAFLILCFPFMIWQFMSSKFLLGKLAMLTLILTFPVVIALTGSRIGFVGWLAEVIIISLFMIKGSKRIVFVAFLTALSTYLIVSGITDDLQLVDKMMKAVSTGGQKGSILVRINTTLDGLWMVSQSYGIGIGVGGFEYVMLHKPVPFYTYGISNPHNFSIEIMAEYGLLVFCLFAIVILLVFYFSFRKYRSENSEDSLIGIICFIAINGYLFATVANSSYLEQPVNWIFLGSVIGLLSISNAKYQIKPMSNQREVHS